MQVDIQVIKQTEVTLKFLARNLRQGDIDAGKVSALSKLLDQYGNLIRLSREEDSGFYEAMKREAYET